jgi:hypothetical protein
MKLSKPFFVLAAAMTVLASAPARADHGHYHGGARVGVVIGTPGYWRYPDPYFYPPYPYYSYPPVVLTPAEPPTYIQQAPAPQQQAQPSNDWYYCRKPEGYYPYVKQCPGGWQRVSPQPPQP